MPYIAGFALLFDFTFVSVYLILPKSPAFFKGRILAVLPCFAVYFTFVSVFVFVSNTFVRSVLSVRGQVSIFVQRCSCFRTLKTIILRTKPEHNAAGGSGGAESGKGESHYGTSLQFQRRPQHAARKGPEAGPGRTA
jgi:hypothetical protein